jgi:hypothetical protein
MTEAPRQQDVIKGTRFRISLVAESWNEIVPSCPRRNYTCATCRKTPEDTLSGHDLKSSTRATDCRARVLRSIECKDCTDRRLDLLDFHPPWMTQRCIWRRQKAILAIRDSSPTTGLVCARRGVCIQMERKVYLESETGDSSLLPQKYLCRSDILDLPDLRDIRIKSSGSDIWQKGDSRDMRHLTYYVSAVRYMGLYLCLKMTLCA